MLATGHLIFHGCWYHLVIYSLLALVDEGNDKGLFVHYSCVDLIQDAFRTKEEHRRSGVGFAAAELVDV